VDFWQNIGS